MQWKSKFWQEGGGEGELEVRVSRREGWRTRSRAGDPMQIHNNMFKTNHYENLKLNIYFQHIFTPFFYNSTNPF